MAIKKIKRNKHKNMKEVTFLRGTSVDLEYLMKVTTGNTHLTTETFWQNLIYSQTLDDWRFLFLFTCSHTYRNSLYLIRPMRRKMLEQMNTKNIRYWKKERAFIQKINRNYDETK